MANILFLTPWRLATRENAGFFESELAKELAPHHALFGRRWSALGFTRSSDDVLFQLEDGAVAQVHLTYSSHPETLGFPGHQVFASLFDWTLGEMIPDHVDHHGLWAD
jgi:hypothetical protein